MSRGFKIGDRVRLRDTDLNKYDQDVKALLGKELTVDAVDAAAPKVRLAGYGSWLYYHRVELVEDATPLYAQSEFKVGDVVRLKTNAGNAYAGKNDPVFHALIGKDLTVTGVFGGMVNVDDVGLYLSDRFEKVVTDPVFKVGDLVRLKDDGDNRFIAKFVPNFNNLFGKTVMVTDVPSDNLLVIAEHPDPLLRTRFEMVCAEKPAAIRPPFTIGDRVIVRDSAANVQFKEFIGKVGVVILVEPGPTGTICVKYEKQNGDDEIWWWRPERLDHAPARKFKPGDLVWTHTAHGAAKAGAQAIVTGYMLNDGTEYLDIVWIRSGQVGKLVGEQKDGRYVETAFLASPTSLPITVPGPTIDRIVYPVGRILRHKNGGGLSVVEKMNVADAEVTPLDGNGQRHNRSIEHFIDTGVQVPFKVGSKVVVKRTSNFGIAAMPGAHARVDRYEWVHDEVKVVVSWTYPSSSVRNGAFPLDVFEPIHPGVGDINTCFIEVGDIIRPEQSFVDGLGQPINDTMLGVATGVDAQKRLIYVVWINAAAKKAASQGLSADKFETVVDAQSDSLDNGREVVSTTVYDAEYTANAVRPKRYVVTDGDVFGPFDDGDKALEDAGERLGGAVRLLCKP